MPASAIRTAPRTFWSEAALTAAVDAAFAEALAEELASALREPSPDRPAIVLPDTETLIRQSGIITGPRPPDHRAPSAARQLLVRASTFTLHAAWWLLKNTTLITGALLLGTARLLWPTANRPADTQAGSPITPADFLMATSDLLKERGWTQGYYEGEHGMCIVGAERSLIRSGVGTSHTAAAANRHLSAVTGSRCASRWNEHSRRTEEQVHAALLAAAARARAIR